MATLLLGAECVLTCGYCGAQSTDTLSGADGWTLIKPNSRALSVVRDCCPACKEELGYGTNAATRVARRDGARQNGRR